MEDTSTFLAKFWGWYLIIFFFVLSLNPKRIVQIMKDLYDQKFVIIFSSLAIILGLLNILLHNVWKNSWILIITLIGWVSLIIGLALFIFPKKTIKWLNYINVKFVQIIYLLLFLIGVFLLNMAYKIVLY
ncbi:hypothetical protein [Lutibacter sp. B1]|uniref:hypothetical protein n=1 Tax=Lutibacter sp. B1 TaxID=2725996 RepID=UPI0014577313|nr:hypothetical protein [Lutibacter sp. B1]NLP58675.1 hypothetical protein [Lutibacter sp. B1]